ncbi:MAG TPA: tetratricopeptide repeat protein [Candidatus Udaeobacter sp.]|nr:tetratricopeptide repeat protein [Candidatus Udaeobacter sp.]
MLFVGVGIRDAYYNRGAAKIKKGDLDGAIADFNREIELQEAGITQRTKQLKATHIW